MKTVDVAEASEDLLRLLMEVEAGHEVVIVRDGKPVARLSKAPLINRTPGVLADTPAWKDFRYDPAIFAPLMTDEELAAEGWPV